MSHALNRLRHHLGDELFVRTRAGMMPTARAMEVGERLREAVRQVDLVFNADGFDPATARGRFVLAANDMMTATVVARLVSVLAKTAPGIDLVVRPSTRIDLAEQIDMGLIDVALGVFPDVPARIHAEVVRTMGDVAALRAGHPEAAGLTAKGLARFPLAAVSLGGTPHSLALPPMIAVTDMVAIVPDLLSELFRAAGLLVVPLPYQGAMTSVRLIWHRRMSTDPGHAWFRTLVAQIADEP